MYIIEVRRTFAADTLDALPKLPVKHTHERALWRCVRRVRHKRRRPVAQHRYLLDTRYSFSSRARAQPWFQWAGCSTYLGSQMSLVFCAFGGDFPDL